MPLYLPDQVTVTHGPVELIGRFILQGYEAARRMGYLLSWRTDMAELCRINRLHHASWFPIATLFDPAFCALDESNSGWIEARDEDGELAAVIALRLLDWSDEPETNLKIEIEAGRFFLGERGDWQVTAPSAEAIGGRVFYPGALWIHPAHRHGPGLGYLLCHLAIALAWTNWAPDFAASVVKVYALERGVASRYGMPYVEHGVFVRNSPRVGDLDLVLTWLPRREYAQSLTSYLDYEMFGERSGVISRTTETSVATLSPRGRFHGSMSRSYENDLEPN
jgi:hypothetical protein